MKPDYQIVVATTEPTNITVFSQRGAGIGVDGLVGHPAVSCPFSYAMSKSTEIGNV